MPEYEGWFRQLAEGRMEVFLKANGVRVRASGEEEGIHELVDWFEETAGVRVVSPNWRRVSVTPIPGQLKLVIGGQDV